MQVPGIIVARTDAEAANLLDGNGDERDQPFLLGATNVAVPTYKAAVLSIMRKLNELGVDEINGHQMFAMSETEYEATLAWLKRSGVMSTIESNAKAFKARKSGLVDAMLDTVIDGFLDAWQTE